MTVFMICFGVGLLFLIVTALLGGLGDFGGHVDVGGHEIDLGGGEGGGDVGGHAVGLSPVSPILISFFLTAFGAVGGICMSLWNIPFSWSLLIALVMSFAMATLVYFLLLKVFEATQGGVEVNVSDLPGREADVITGIPKGGTGEIAFITSGGRLNGPARSEDGKPIPYNTVVRIVKVVGNTYIVRKAEAGESPPAPSTQEAE